MSVLRQFDASAWHSAAEQRLDNPEVRDPRASVEGSGIHIGHSGRAQSLDDLD
jgi:hypothetical protein